MEKLKCLSYYNVISEKINLVGRYMGSASQQGRDYLVFVRPNDKQQFLVSFTDIIDYDVKFKLLDSRAIEVLYGQG